ncbi:MAG: radical SAM protein [Flavobacteriales bacterium]|nr:radical SAM protein [Flavobacteriales bacterium]
MLKNFLKRLTFTESASAGKGIPSNIIKAYNATRSVKRNDLLCHAPYSNMYFNTEGHVALCWKTFHRHEVYSEDRSIMGIWRGKNFEKIRAGIKTCDLEFGCQECKKHLLEGNFVNVLSKAYDNDHLHPEYPTIMEFELSNRCNLGCTMCNGNLSSTIRRDREKLPPLNSPYGDKFIHELKEFIPHLKEARFNGGEPFLIKQYYSIWDNVFQLNSGLKMVIATNGTVLTSKVKEYMQRGNFHFNVSIDGFSPETYESIRVGGNFDRLMENLDYFISYCKQNSRTLCIMINPMRQNWWEMPDFVNFCNEKNIHLWFNTIMKPADQALWSLPASRLKEILDTLASARLKTRGVIASDIERYNIRTYKNLVEQQITKWYEEALLREGETDRMELHEEADARTKAIFKIRAYFGGDRKEEASEVLDKLVAIEQMIDSPQDKELFFEMILGSNPETLLEMGRTQTATELHDRFRVELKNQ